MNQSFPARLVLLLRFCLSSVWIWFRALAQKPGNRFSVLLLGILLVAGYLHSQRWSAGLPYCHNWDEPQIIQPAIRVIRNGIYEPSRFDYGPVSTYLHAGWMSLNYLSGSSKGYFPDGIYGLTSDRETAWYWSVTSPFLWQRARMLSSILVLGGLLLTAFAARRLAGSVAGIATAVLGTLSLVIYRTGTIVSPDALAYFATALTLWLSVKYLKDGSKALALLATLAAALAATAKYNYVVVVMLPMVAHGLRIIRGEERLGQGIQLGAAGTFVGGVLLFLSPAFANPTGFLHDVSTAMNFYVATEPLPWWKAPFGYFGKIAALLNGGDYLSTGPGGIAGQNNVLDWRLLGLPCVVLAIWGLWFGSRKLRLGILILALPVAFAILAAGPDSAFYFTRYLLPAFPCLAILFGLGVVGAGRFMARYTGRSPGWNSSILLGFVALALLANMGKALLPQPTESRTLMSQWMLENLPKGTRIWISHQTRWHLTKEETSKFQIRMGTLGQLLHTPLTPEDADYVLVPTKCALVNQIYDRPALVERYNKWLDKLIPEHITGKQNAPVYFGRPSIDPGIMLVPVANLTQSVRYVPTNKVPGLSLGPNPADWDKVRMADGPLAVLPGITVTSPVILTTRTLSVQVLARGTSPYRQEVQPALSVELESLDTRSTQTIRADFVLNRSQAGLVPYSRALSSPASPGKYRVKVRTTDHDYLPVAVENLEFLPAR